MMRTIRRSKQHKKANRKTHRGGALYSFNLNDKIGGLPARIPLNGTEDGDCPNCEIKDLGFVNYGIKQGGGRKSRRHSKSRKTSRKTHRKSRKTRKTSRKH
jgi:hypothetical protein